MREDQAEGEPGPIFNLDTFPEAAALREAVAEARAGGLVWITEGGKRIAAIVSREAAESLARLRSALLAGDCEDFEPFFEAIKALGGA